jgi:hypothetical protein
MDDFFCLWKTFDDCLENLEFCKDVKKST